MLFLLRLKLNVHLHLSKFKGFLPSQHVVRDTLMKMMEAAFAQPLSLTGLHTMEKIMAKIPFARDLKRVILISCFHPADQCCAIFQSPLSLSPKIHYWVTKI